MLALTNTYKDAKKVDKILENSKAILTKKSGLSKTQKLVKKLLQNNQNLTNTYQISATPTFIIDGQVTTGDDVLDGYLAD